MKISEIQVGGPYLAKISGNVQVVRVVELCKVPPASLWARSAWRTLIWLNMIQDLQAMVFLGQSLHS
jgi:hypothetical protein